MVKKERLEDYVTTIPDFPKEGIMFRDITTVIEDPDGFKMAVDGLVEMFDREVFDVVVSTEARGFIFGAPVAHALRKGLVLARKKGKLPRETVSETYALEYGEATLEIHKDAIKPGMKVVIIDDLLATGGTVDAVVKMVEKLGGTVIRIGFVIELEGFKARKTVLRNYPTESLISYPGN